MSTDSKIIDDRGLEILFREARTYNGWRDKPVPDVLIEALYDLMKWGPTAGNSCPARFAFVRSPAEKERLKPHLSAGNVDKTMQAPVTAIVAYDLDFYERIPELFPHNPDAKNWYAGKPDLIQETALRNGSLQGAYLMLAARALGLDCGPMSGFTPAGVKAAFFPDDNVQPNFLCNLGYGDPASLNPRGPRLSFDTACRIV